jgi:hypothetical protein
MSILAIQNTDLEISAYVTGAGRLVIRVNKGGICVVDGGIDNATAELTVDQLVGLGMFLPPLNCDLKRP